MEENNNKPTVVEGATKMNAMSMYFEQSQFETSMRVCRMLASSDLVPINYQYKPVYPNPKDDGEVAVNRAAESKAIANCLIALNKAAQLNSDPLTIMQNMAIVHGRPSWSSSFLIATVNSCGRFKPLKFRFGSDGTIETGKKTIPNLTCVCYTTERGSDEVLEGAEISMEMAKAEGWLEKNGSKWQTMPKQMLMYRAASFWTRVYAPEISQGMYTKDEVMEFTEYEEIDTHRDVDAREDVVSGANVEVPTFEEANDPDLKADVGQEMKKRTTPGF